MLEVLEERAVPAIITVTKDVDDGTAGTFRSAIDQSNQSVGVRDTIRFSIGAAGSTHTITLDANRGALDPIADAVFIDGFSQAGPNGTTTVPLIEIDGTNIQNSGLVVNTGNTVIDGLAISKFGSIALELNNPANSIGDVVSGCFIGCGLSGASTASGNNGDGIRVTGANNYIGDVTGQTLNVISGNAFGISIFGSTAHDNTVAGNNIGVDVTGMAALPNANSGVIILNGAAKNHIGDDVHQLPGLHNIISGNKQQGIYINSSSNNFVTYNYVGLGQDGTASIGNTANGVFIDGQSTVNLVSSNTISSNGISGVSLSGTGVTNNTIQGCSIGTDAGGSLARGNVQQGVLIDNGSFNTLGGTVLAQGNIISGNGKYGVSINGMNNKLYGNDVGTNTAVTAALANTLGGVYATGGTNFIGSAAVGGGNVISGNGGNGVTMLGIGGFVAGNWIGTNLAGTAALANTGDGVAIIGGSNITIGSALAAGANWISGNSGNGVSVSGDNNFVYGNRIGTTGNGATALKNGSNGVSISGTGNHVGSAAAGTGNVISGNGNDGISIVGDQTEVAGNLIGTDATGKIDVGNTSHGIYVQGNFNTIGEAADGRNVICKNGGAGLYIWGSDTTVANNYIGVGKDGTTKLGNSLQGIYVTGGTRNVIGGTNDEATRNVISGNSYGIWITGGSGNRIQGNYIGLLADGTTAFGNTNDGVYIQRSMMNSVGGIGNAKNTICGNGGFGVELGVGCTMTTVQNNSIGKDINGNVKPNTKGWKNDLGTGNTWTADNIHD